MARSARFMNHLGWKVTKFSDFPPSTPPLEAGKWVLLGIPIPKSSKWEPSGKHEAYDG